MKWFYSVLTASIMALAHAQVLRAEVELDNTPSAEANLRFALRQLGTIEGGTAQTRIVVLKTETPFAALNELRRARGVTVVRPLVPALPRGGRRVNSISESQTESRRYRAEYALYHRAQFGDDTKPKRTPSVNYLDSYLHFLEERSYPNDFINDDERLLAIAQRDRMPAAETGANAGPETVGTWQFVGPRDLDIPYQIYYGTPPLAGRINALTYDPQNPQTYYIAAAGGGIWKTTNAGVNWTPLSDGWESLWVNAITVHPTNSNILYAGTGDFNGGQAPGFGIMKSVDGGQTWTNLGRAAFQGSSIRRILLDPGNPNNLLVASGYGTNELFRSTDGGNTFSVVQSNVAHWCDLEVSIPVSGTRNFWAVAESLPAGGSPLIYRSQNSGATWTSISIPGLAGVSSNSLDVAVSPTNGNRVYVLAATARKLFRSDNNGSTWTDLSGVLTASTSSYNFSQASYDWHLNVAAGQSGNDKVFVGLIDLMMSIDNGNTWQSLGGPTYDNDSILHNDQHSLAIHPTDPNQALVGCDGGVFRFIYNPPSNSWQFTPLNLNLGGTTQFYHASFHPSDRNFVLGGTQDNASPVATGDLQTWDNVGGGDGGITMISRVNPQHQATTAQFLFTYVTTNAWASSGYVGPSVGSDSVAFIAPIAEDPTSANTLYGGTNFLYRYTYSTGTWEARLGGTNLAPSGGNLRSIAVAPSNSNVIYTGSSTGDVHISVNRGATWRRIDASLPNRGIKDISILPDDPFDVLISQSGSAGSARVWRCPDTSVPNLSWFPVSGSGSTALPDIVTSSIERDYRDPINWWWAGNDVGVFRTTDGGATWQNATAPLGLPNVRIDEVKTIAGTNSLYAATHGRGIWRIDLGSTALDSVNVTNPAYTLNPATITVVLSEPAPPGGAIVSLSSSNPSQFPVPSSVTVAAGQTQVTVDVVPPYGRVDLNPIVTATMNGEERQTSFFLRALSADVNRDGEVGPADFALLALAFGSFLGDANYNPNADANLDGEVGPEDFALLAAQFGLP